MIQIFLKIVNMSISASYIVLAVLLLRLLLRKAPKWVSVLLWGIVAVRLVCPFSVESVLSLIPSAEVVSPDIMTDHTPTVNTGIPILNSTVNPIIGESLSPAPGDSANPLQIWIPVLATIWVVGVLALLCYALISYARIRRKIGTAVLYKDNIYQSENVASPFVLGIFKPRIYLPFHISEKNMPHVIAHEQAHLCRKDHFFKPLGFLLLSLHWFNPLLWLGYLLLCRDIELACDEKVIGALDQEARASYSEALLTFSVSRRAVAACPLAFGEVGVKERVKSVLTYKKPTFWIVLTAMIACIVVAVCFLTNPESKSPNLGETDPRKLSDDQVILMEQHPEYFGLDASEGLDVYVWQMAKNSYSFALLPHTEAHTDVHPVGSLPQSSLRGVNTETMRTILATYDISENDVHIILWQNLLSSYIAEWQLVREGENMEEKRETYATMIREMLFGSPQQGEIEKEETDEIADLGQHEVITIVYLNEDGHVFYEPHSCETFFVEDTQGGFYYHRFLKTCSDCGEVLKSADIYRCKINHSKCKGGCLALWGYQAELIPGEPRLIYSAPALSWVTSYVPEVRIQGNHLLYDAKKEELLGTVSKTEITDETFSSFWETANNQYSALADSLRQNNVVFYEVHPAVPSNVDLYYVMLQKDGSSLLVYGHYENGEKIGFVRWIFSV